MMGADGRSSTGRGRDLRVMVDTSSWLHDHAEPFLREFLVPLVREHEQRIVIPHVVTLEIEKHLRSPKPRLRRQAESADNLVARLRRAELADVFAGSEQTFADNAMQMVIIRFCERYRFCLVTQDRDLATDVLRLNLRRSVRAKPVIAYRIGAQGRPTEWRLGQNDEAVWHELDEPEPAEPPFELCSDKPVEDNRVELVTRTIEEGDIALDGNGQRVRLARKLGSGGEGRVFSTDAGLVCKIYEDSRRTVAARQKLELMITRSAPAPGIAWPRSLAFNDKGEFVGFFMPEAPGMTLQRAVFIKALFQEKFPNWSRIDLAQLAITILEPIAALHDLNVLLGDINPSNIHVVDADNAYLIDTDSYQVERFPCRVGTATFLAPELFGRDLSTVLRTPEQELFAVATLVFMILVPGKPPFSHQGGGDPAENVRRRHFPYPLGSRWTDEGDLKEGTKSAGVPQGPWRFIWSHFPVYLKEAFYGVFKDDRRPTTREWIVLLSRYRDDIRRGYVSSEIYPVGFKRLRREDVERKGGTWKTCAACQAGFGDFDGRDSLCVDCRNKPASATCYLCGHAFETRTSRLQNGREPVCERCNALELTAACRDCHATFAITASDRVWCKQRGWDLYKRCKDCRARKRGGDAPAVKRPPVTTIQGQARAAPARRPVVVVARPRVRAVAPSASATTAVFSPQTSSASPTPERFWERVRRWLRF